MNYLYSSHVENSISRSPTFYNAFSDLSEKNLDKGGEILCENVAQKKGTMYFAPTIRVKTAHEFMPKIMA